MARQAGVNIENNFVRGLITETTALKFPENACTDTLNCVFDETGRVTRRLGIDIEPDGLGITITPTSTDAYTEYRWDAPAGNGTRSFLVQQQGEMLFFYDVSSGNTVGSSADQPLGEVDLSTYLAGNSPLVASEFPCQYSTGNGDLIVTSEAIDIIYIVFDESNQTFTANPIGIYIRDFEGFPEDGFELTERPNESGGTLAANFPRHFYNILNQSWALTDALTQWDTARGDMPSNADYVGLYRSSETDSFDTTLVTSQSSGNRPAPKGHFLMVPYAIDRTATLVAEGFAGIDVDPDSAAYILNGYTQIRLSPDTINPTVATYSAALDTVTTQTANGCATLASNQGAMMIGINTLTAGTALRITECKIYGSSDSGFIVGANPAMTINLYASQGAAPTSPTAGTLLGTVSFTDTADESAGRTITSSDPSTFWNNVWIHVFPDSGTPSDIRVAEFQLLGVALDPSNSSTYKRPRCNEFFAGRAWYAGVDALGLNNSLYFSQIIQTRDQYNKCYQVNDPTSEDFSDLLPDDGGVIKIPEMGTVQRMVAYQSSLIVIASNGVWIISGTTGGFAANDYTVKKISSQGSLSPLSTANVNGVPVWWGDDGIFTVAYSSEYDSFTIRNLSEQTIREFYLNIPSQNRAYAKGAFDSSNGIAYWLYNDTANITQEEYYVYNSVLVLNTISGAFYPWSISDLTDVLVRGISYIQDASRVEDGRIKFTSIVDTGSATNMFWAEEFDDAYTDWTAIATALTVSPVDYDSFFITGYKIHGEGQRFFQSNYVFVYLDTLANSSCFMQGIFDWTNSTSSHKWSALQQIYNSSLTNRDVNLRRLKVRGKGRALQLRFESEAGKPFSIIGWSIWETGNAGL